MNHGQLSRMGGKLWASFVKKSGNKYVTKVVTKVADISEERFSPVLFHSTDLNVFQDIPCGSQTRSLTDETAFKHHWERSPDM